MKRVNLNIKYSLVVSFISLLFCFLFASETYLKYVSKQEINYVQKQLRDANKQYEEIGNKLSSEPITLEVFKQYFNETFSIQYFNNNKLKLWSSRKYLPTRVIERLPSKGSFIVPYENKYYKIVKKELNNQEQLVFVRELTDDKGILSSTYLKTVQLQISPNKEKLGQQISSINNLGGQLYLHPISSNNNWALFICWYVFILSSFLLLYFYFKHNKLPYKQYIRLCILIATFVLLNLFIQSDPFNVYEYFQIFKPHIWADKFLAKSLGNLFINILTLIFVVGLWYNYSTVLSSLQIKKEIKIAIVALLVSISSAAFIYFSRSSIVDSSVPILDNNLLRWGLILAQLMLGFIYFICIVRLLRFINNISESSKDKVVFVLQTFGTTFVFLLIANFNFFEAIQFVFWAITIVLIIFIVLDQKNKISTLKQIVIISLIFAFFATFCAQTYSLRAEKNRLHQIAKKIATKEDSSIVYDIEQINNEILADKVLANQLNLPFFTNKAFENRLRAVHLKNVLPDYSKEVFIKEVSFDDEKELSLEPQISTIKTSFSQFATKDILPLKVGDRLFEIEINFKKQKFAEVKQINDFNSSNNKVNLYQNLPIEKISYYVIENDKVIDVYGAGMDSFSVSKFKKLKYDDFEFIKTADGKRNYVYKFENNGLLFIALSTSKIAENMWNVLAYTFTIIIYFYLFSIAFYSKFNINRIEFYRKSLTNRIQYFILAFIYFATLVIGFFTNRSSQEQTSDFQNLRYTETIEKVSNQFLVDTDLLENNPQEYVALLKQSFKNSSEDVYLYALDGNLLFANNERLFNKKVWPRKINPEALYQLQYSPKNSIVMNESIFDKKYKGVYQSLKNKQLETIAYAYIPWFDSNYNLKEENRIYSNLLFNTFSLVLFMITLLSIFLMNSFGQLFERIRQQLSTAGIGKELRTLEWKNEDEIGLLIQEYNNMVTKLDKSAVALARSERESAWKDMAKQIAHEIKNPLTPMKLSIQHLKRRLEMDGGEQNEKVIRTLNNLETQIGHLTNIANDFSSIAKMANLELKELNFKDIVYDVYQMYKNSNKYEVVFKDETQKGDASILADHTQINRVIINLVKNAGQAIPEDRAGKIELLLQEQEDSYVLSVIDNGKGIPIENRAKIFTPNFTTKKSGTGIGLMMSKRIIETHGGEISFTSKEGQGTTFKVVLKKNQ